MCVFSFERATATHRLNYSDSFLHTRCRREHNLLSSSISYQVEIRSTEMKVQLCSVIFFLVIFFAYEQSADVVLDKISWIKRLMEIKCMWHLTGKRCEMLLNARARNVSAQLVFVRFEHRRQSENSMWSIACSNLDRNSKLVTHNNSATNQP